jgi:ketosteroid isomerase-like protein
MSERDVRAAADGLVAAFAAGRVDDYFACFHPDATFVFHTAPDRLDSAAEYRALWERWARDDGFQVLACASTGARVQLVGDGAAVLTHDVATRVRTTAGEEDLRERETIVFALRDGRWLAVHEHLSPAPGGS